MKHTPPYWFSGMQNTDLQLLIEHQGHYAFLDVDTRGMKPGIIHLEVEISGETITFPYELKERRPHSSERKSFTPSDVIYLLMPDRIATKQTTPVVDQMYHGGNINGIRRHLDYYADLGVTALWLTPVINNTPPASPNNQTAKPYNRKTTKQPYHGYSITDFYSIEPQFGTFEDYQHLVEEAHSKGLKIIKDFVFNHCSIHHPWIANPPEADWINHPDGKLITNYRLTPTIDPYASAIDKQQTIEGWFVSSMPDLNLSNKHLQRYLSQCAIWWIETTGIDGIRMDTYPYSDADAMEHCLKDIHMEYPHFHIVGETWVCNSAFTAHMQQGELDSSMDFALYEAFSYAKHEDSNEWWSGMNRIYNTLCYDYLYKDAAMTLAFLDNHDVSRFIEDKPSTQVINRMKCALALLLTLPRVPQLYYGTELLFSGSTSISDAYVRQDFHEDLFYARKRTARQNDMHRFLRTLLRWRKENPVIAYGSTTQFMPHNGIYVIARTNPTKTVLTIVNGNNTPATLDICRYSEVLPPHPTFRNVLTGRQLSLTNKRLTPNQVLVLETE